MAGMRDWTRSGRRSTRRGRAATTVAGTVLVALALTACGGGEGSGLPTALPTTRPTLPSVTLPTLPSPTLPSVTLPTLPPVTLPTPTLPTLPAVPTLPTSSPDATPEPTATATAAPPVVETEDPETADPEAADPEDAVAEDGSAWLWLLLLLLVAAAAAVAAVLLRRRRQRAAWAEALDEPIQEATWLRDAIVPNLLAQSPDGRAGIWAIGRPRVLTLEQSLVDLVAQAPDHAAVTRVGALSAAVQALRRALDFAAGQVAFGGAATTAALQQSQSELDDAIRALRPPSEDRVEETPLP